MSGIYDDIIDRKRPVSRRADKMSISDRAAQFSPFAALSGYEEAVEETARLTDEKKTLTDEAVAVLNAKLQTVLRYLDKSPKLKICYFIPDDRKSGGEYVTVRGVIKRIDDYEGCLFMADGLIIPLGQIREIEGKIFDVEEK
ncbi:MAG: hypothetical protein J6Q78_00975 [Clostridia bacterium]|nr:hypothetical protein [Clostridia bacterium]